jgi:hypothetical protein
MPDLHATSLLKVAPEIAAMFRTDPVLAAFLDPAVHIEVDDEGHVTHKFVERLQLGLAASGLSMYDTLSHAWDPSFEAPALSLGRRHTNYHAFREFTLSVGVAAVLIWGMFQPAGKRRRELWVAMLAATLGYYIGWWLPWPLLGLHAPNNIAEGVHLAATILTLVPVILARTWFRD